MNGKRSRTLKVDVLTRVEGEGALDLKFQDRVLTDVKLRIYEPPRFFEGLLRGRRFDEAPDITARVCGICPVAYQTSAATAMEAALGLDLGPARLGLRRLLYFGEWIESHALHVYLLHAPDFLGFENVIEMARDHGAEVERGLALKKVGNDLMSVIGGREIHPVNVRVGGFYSWPPREALVPFVERLERARDAALETTRWVAGFAFPDFERDYEFVAASHPTEYPLLGARVVSSGGLDFPVSAFEDHVIEEHVPYSNALHAVLKGRGSYLVGPLARFSLAFDRLTPTARDAARAAGIGPLCRNPFKSIVVRGVEMVHACEEALRLVKAYEPEGQPAVEATPRAGVGHGCSEAPRGVLYHRYRLDDQGLIAEARIVPPTSQNQKAIENDLWRFVPGVADLPDEELSRQCEQAIRNHDPCISCATHFLRLNVAGR